MKPDKPICVTRHGDIAHVEIVRAEKRNALSVAILENLYETVIALRNDRDLAAIILSGRGGFFSAGADLHDPLIFSPEISLEKRLYYSDLATEIARAWEALPQVTYAAIEGFAVGGGLVLAMACDFRLMGRGAFVYVPEVDIGASYGWNAVPRLVSLIGPARTKRLVLMAQKVTADESERWGLVDFIVDDGAVIDEAMCLARVMAEKPRMAVQVTKKAINAVSTVFNQISAHGDNMQVKATLEAHKRSEAYKRSSTP